MGAKAVNALSTHFTVESYRGEIKRAQFERGDLVNGKQGKTEERNGTMIAFRPDRDVFRRTATAWNTWSGCFGTTPT